MYKRSIVAFLVGVFVLSAGIEGRADVIFDTRIRAMTHYVGHVLAPDGADTGAFVAIAVGPSPIKGSLEIAGYVCDGTPMGQFQYYRGLVPNDGGGALLSLSAETTLSVRVDKKTATGTIAISDGKQHVHCLQDDQRRGLLYGDPHAGRSDFRRPVPVPEPYSRTGSEQRIRDDYRWRVHTDWRSGAGVRRTPRYRWRAR